MAGLWQVYSNSQGERGVMATLVYLLPIALFLGALGLGAFLWALRTGQYDDLDGAAERVLIDADPRGEP
jgi:cbb3-type cytochrome oxidase maturation protein